MNKEEKEGGKCDVRVVCLFVLFLDEQMQIWQKKQTMIFCDAKTYSVVLIIQVHIVLGTAASAA